MNYGFPIRPKRKTGKTEKHCGTSVLSRHPQKKNPKNPRATARCFSGFSICAFITCRPESTQPSGFSVFRVFRQGYRRGCGSFMAKTPAGNANRAIYLGIESQGSKFNLIPIEGRMTHGSFPAKSPTGNANLGQTLVTKSCLGGYINEELHQ